MDNCSDYSWEEVLSGKAEARLWPVDLTPKIWVPDFGFNPLNLGGKLYFPEYDRQQIKAGKLLPKWPGNKRFAVCLTHDLDCVSAWSWREGLRLIRRSLRLSSGRQWALKLAGRSLFLGMVHLGGRDPFHCLDEWMDLEAEYGVRSTFFVLSDRVSKCHFTDGTYRFRDRLSFRGKRVPIAKALNALRAGGWEIGLHSSWYSFDDPCELRLQKERVEEITGSDVVSVRQHFLHFDVRVTPSVQAQAGFRYDATLGFNDNVGFRFGTCHPFMFDLEGACCLEIPLIIQDIGLLGERKGLMLDERMAMEYIACLSSRVEEVGGVLSLSWHPNNFTKPLWRRVYERAIAHLKDRGAWFGTVRAVGEHWLKHVLDSGPQEWNSPGTAGQRNWTA